MIYADKGKLRGGNSIFTYVGVYEQVGRRITGTVTTKRHTHDPTHKSVLGLDEATVRFEGVEKDGMALADGRAVEAPVLALKVLLKRVSD